MKQKGYSYGEIVGWTEMLPSLQGKIPDDLSGGSQSGVVGQQGEEK